MPGTSPGMTEPGKLRRLRKTDNGACHPPAFPANPHRMTGAGTDRTKTAISGGPAVVLVRPQLAVNIGMCARAMANFGLSDLRLVNPKSGWPRADEYRDVAYAAAAGAAHILDAARVFGSAE